jgi:hypothetical protein
VSDRINLADPDFEPTDEQLIELSREAFAHVRGEHEASLRALRLRIADARREALSRLQKARP